MEKNYNELTQIDLTSLILPFQFSIFNCQFINPGKSVRYTKQSQPYWEESP